MELELPGLRVRLDQQARLAQQGPSERLAQLEQRERPGQQVLLEQREIRVQQERQESPVQPEQRELPGRVRIVHQGRPERQVLMGLALQEQRERQV